MNINLANLHKNERGIAHLALILIVLAVVGVGGFAFWRVASYNNNRDANGTPVGSGSSNTATLSDECVAMTKDENICRLGSISDLSKFSAEVRVTMQGAEGPVTSVVKYDGKGNSQVSGLADGINIGGKTYVYLFDKWYDAGGDASQKPDDPASSFSIATTAGIKYENLGKEPCGDDTCYRYRMSGGILGDGVVVCLFGDKDYLPRYYEATGGLTGDLTMTIEYKSITITAPEGALPISSLVPGGI